MVKGLCPFYNEVIENSGTCSEQKTGRHDGNTLSSCLAKGDLKICLEEDYVLGIRDKLVSYMANERTKLYAIEKILIS